MRFGKITRSLVAQFRSWELPSKIAFALAAALLVLLIALGGQMPPEFRNYTLIGIIGLFVAMQAIFLYASRGMVAAYTQAQRLMLDGDLEAARAVLEDAVAKSRRPDFRVLTLLGNAYRMLGHIDDSLQTLTKALQIAPDHHFPLYGLGRTLMASGRYSEAVTAFDRAVGTGGAPVVATIDLAEALYRSGDDPERLNSLLDREHISTDWESEPHLQLMVAYLCWRMGKGGVPVKDLISAGLPYWEKTAARFAHTPYGEELQRDVDALRTGSI